LPNLVKTNVRDNEIGDSLLRANSKAASARLNMGGIIALGVFGGFVFLAAVITIVLIIVRRFKNSQSSLDAQTISTFDSSGDHQFYQKYQSAWSQLGSSGVHSGTYKPSGMSGRLENGMDPYSNQRIMPNRGGTMNEGFREANEITLNADVAALYSRPDKRYKRERGQDSERDGQNQTHWQHIRNGKY